MTIGPLSPRQWYKACATTSLLQCCRDHISYNSSIADSSVLKRRSPAQGTQQVYAKSSWCTVTALDYEVSSGCTRWCIQQPCAWATVMVFASFKKVTLHLCDSDTHSEREGTFLKGALHPKQANHQDATSRRCFSSNSRV
jgi:hypothetical protein